MNDFRELSAFEIDTVSGGMMNNGQGDTLQTQPKYGGPPDRSSDSGLAGGILVGAILFTLATL
ncbi:MAG: hypothetical protein ABIO35_07945 [Nitrobacter sp.]|jgi:hypothetical protein